MNRLGSCRVPMSACSRAILMDFFRGPPQFVQANSTSDRLQSSLPHQLALQTRYYAKPRRQYAFSALYPNSCTQPRMSSPRSNGGAPSPRHLILQASCSSCNRACFRHLARLFWNHTWENITVTYFSCTRPAPRRYTSDLSPMFRRVEG